jgi:hypothetical protein
MHERPLSQLLTFRAASATVKFPERARRWRTGRLLERLSAKAGSNSPSA